MPHFGEDWKEDLWQTIMWARDDLQEGFHTTEIANTHVIDLLSTVIQELSEEIRDYLDEMRQQALERDW